MAKKTFEVLSETMFYVLMALMKNEMCGIEIAVFTDEKTNGRVKLGAGTLYTILNKFENEEIITEIEVSGRKRTYKITENGKKIYLDEVKRLKQCLLDSESEGIYEVQI